MSVGRAINLKDFAKYLAKLRTQLNGADGAIVRGIHSGVMRALPVVQQAVDNAPPASPNGGVGAFDTGDYKRRWAFYLTSSGGGLRNSHPAADVIERGRRRNRAMPPVGAIKAWSKRRLGLSEKEAETAKFAIAKAIAKRGLQGRRVLTSKNTTSEVTRVVMLEVRASVKAALAAAAKGTP